PVARPSGKRRRQSSSTAGPPARWIAPSTPPPPRIARLAALTTASTCCSVMSPRTTIRSMSPSSSAAPTGSPLLAQAHPRPLQDGLPLVGRGDLAAYGGGDRAALLVEVDHARVDVRRPGQRGGVPEELRDLLHRRDLGPLARRLRRPGLVALGEHGGRDDG